jgi:hypothetical protein
MVMMLIRVSSDRQHRAAGRRLARVDTAAERWLTTKEAEIPATQGHHEHRR